MRQHKQKQIYLKIFLLILIFILSSNSQSFEIFQSGIITNQPILYQQNNPEQNYSVIPLNDSFKKNGKIIYSFISFNYFMNQAYCFEKTNSQNYTNSLKNFNIVCSANINKISYLILELSPNLFIEKQNQIFYQRDFSLHRNVSLLPLYEKMKISQLFLYNQNINDLNYNIKINNFITGIKTFSNTSQIISRNKLINVKFKINNDEITLINNKTVKIPSSIKINRSINVKYITFITLIMIQGIPSLNIYFEPLILDKQQGKISSGYFFGMEQFNVAFYGLKSQGKIPSIELNISTLNQNFSLQNFEPKKQLNYSLSPFSHYQFARIHNYSYIRCSGASFIKYQPLKWPIQGKIYRIQSIQIKDFVMTLSQSNINISNNIQSSKLLTTNQWKNLSNQKFYFKYLDGFQYKIYSVQNNHVLFVDSKSNFSKIYSGPQKHSLNQIWQMTSNYYNGTKYLKITNKFTALSMNIEGGFPRDGANIIQYSFKNGSPNRFFHFIQIQQTNSDQMQQNNSIIRSSSFDSIIQFQNTSVLPLNLNSSFFSLQRKKCLSQLCQFLGTNNLNIESLYQASYPIFANDKKYGFCVNNQSFLLYNNLYNYQNNSNNSNQSLLNYTTDLLNPYYGCININKNFSLSNKNNYFSCNKCTKGYTLRNIQIKQTNSNSYSSSKCFCNVGKYMDENSICHSCENHKYKCLMKTQIFAELVQNDQKYEYEDYLSVKIRLLDKIYGYLTYIQKEIKKLVVNVNGLKYNPNEVRLDSNQNSIYLELKGIPSYNIYQIFVESNNTNSSILIKQNLNMSSDTKSVQTSNKRILISNQTNTSYSSPINASENQIYYFSNIKTTSINVQRIFKAKEIINSISSISSAFNSSSSAILIVAPLIIDKIGFLSIFQTNSYLYLISFLKFKTSDNKITQTTKKLFIFRPQPLFNLISLKNQQIQQNKKSLFQIQDYRSQYQKLFLYNQTYSNFYYPKALYKDAIKQLQKNKESYLTLTLNTLTFILFQIFIIEILLKILNLLLAKVQNNNSNKNKNYSQIKYSIKRYNIIQKTNKFKKINSTQQLNKNKITLGLQKYIQWLPNPLLKTQQDLTLQQKKLLKQDQNISSQYIPSLRYKILYLIQQFKDKRILNYTSLIMVQLISQQYLLYFQIIKPFSYTSLQTFFIQLFNMFFALTIMFLLIVFPIIIINSNSLYLLKIVNVIYKYGNYKDKINKETNDTQLLQNQKNYLEQNVKYQQSECYTSQQIFSYFLLIYYEPFIWAFSIAIGSTIFYQCLPIVIYQIFKFIWAHSKLKNIQKIKIILFIMLFSTLGISNYIQSIFDKSKAINVFNQLQQIAIYLILFILIIQILKIIKFIVVLILNSIKKQIKFDNKKRNNKNNSYKSLSKQRNCEIISLQEQTKEKQSQNANNQMIFKKTQKLHHLKRKVQKLKQITQTRKQIEKDIQNLKKQKQVNINNQ